MADASLTSNNPFRRRSAIPSVAAALPTGDISPSSAESGLSLSIETEAAGKSGSSAALLFEQHLQSLQHPTGNEFRDQLRALPKSSEAPPSTTFLNPKPVKKVRVQSPPSSPDSVDADFEARFPAYGSADATTTGGVSNAGRYTVHFADTPSYDEYSSGSEDIENGRDITTMPTIQPVSPHNPFQKTLGDMQTDTEDRGVKTTASAAVGTRAINVDAFRRLLMTGQVDGGEAGATRATGAAISALQLDSASPTDASSVLKQPAVDTAHIPQVSPRSPHEISETEYGRGRLAPSVQTIPPQGQILRKKPPPPSSRHGKLINSTKREKEVADEGAAVMTLSYRSSSGSSAQPSSSSSDMNKHVPTPSMPQNTDEDAEGILDRETVGKIPKVDIDPDAPDDAIPGPRPPTPPNASHAIAFSLSHPISDSATDVLAAFPPTALPALTEAKKPPPPPRRQMVHTRSDSRASAQDRVPSAQSLQSWTESAHDKSPETSRRSSLESTRSRSSSMRAAINVPTPPPPRRPNHAARPSTSFASPTVLSFPFITLETDRSSSTWNGANALGQAQPTTLAMPLTESTTSVAELAPREGAVTTISGGVPTKLAKPAPPPTRSISVRKKEGRAGLMGDLGSGGGGRPSSVLSVDAISHRMQAHSHQQPPPPPPRARGSSRGSADSPLTPAGGTSSALMVPRRVGSDDAQRLGGGLADKSDHDKLMVPSGVYQDHLLIGSTNNNSSSNTILADLDALQREVDALRGQFPE